ncbi:PEX16 isoform 2 [Pan troglodytes]|uniref:Peroxisomal biogenesis factor 16 n=3 Tax=Hominidae TaxID=9604 RepID=E9PSC6_HUMAN|nr:peroxisomal biogenesis factor 16 [Homo sapiens]KAI4070920.1 peroxisomal biogenesis factor 16 [Homo sapiens]PNI46719.1 PEX16 isoform 2 [Pan troglodytes]PNJ68492.1 PEX16 isoform 2 [Pongo abelii]
MEKLRLLGLRYQESIRRFARAVRAGKKLSEVREQSLMVPEPRFKSRSPRFQDSQIVTTSRVFAQ